MDDVDGPVVAGKFYTELFKNGAFDSSQAAYALHEALKQLRSQGVSPVRWATFVHVGA
jgi:hypothetical protein